MFFFVDEWKLQIFCNDQATCRAFYFICKWEVSDYVWLVCT